MKMSDLDESFNRGRRSAYQRDYDSSVSGFGHKDSLAYQQDGGANDEGWDEEPRQHRQPDVSYDVYIDGRKWKTFDSQSHASNVARKLQSNGKKATIHKSIEESASDGATNAANMGVGAVYNNKPPKQPKNKDGTAKNALDMKSTNLLTGGSIKRS